MSNAVKTDDVIFNFFKQICDEKDDKKCVELGNSWINAMETNLTKMEANLEEKDKIKHKVNIQNNRDHLNSMKGKNSSEWREYATKCMIEIIDNKNKIDQKLIKGCLNRLRLNPKNLSGNSERENG